MIKADRWVWAYVGACLFGIGIGVAFQGMSHSRAVADSDETGAGETTPGHRLPIPVEAEAEIESAEAVEPLDLENRQGIRAWYRINPMQLRTRFLLCLWKKKHALSTSWR